MLSNYNSSVKAENSKAGRLHAHKQGESSEGKKPNLDCSGEGITRACGLAIRTTYRNRYIPARDPRSRARALESALNINGASNVQTKAHTHVEAGRHEYGEILPM